MNEEKVLVTEIWARKTDGSIDRKMYFNGYTPHNYFKTTEVARNEQMDKAATLLSQVLLPKRINKRS